MTICPHCQTVNHADNLACTTCGAPLVADPALEGDPFVGRDLGGRFHLQSIIGSGEIGMVYYGTDRRSGREIAVKIVHPDVAATHGDELLRAAGQAAQLRHAKIGAVLAAAREPDGTTFIVSEYIRGETLKALLERTGPVGPRRAADILFQLCSALAPFHRTGRAHANLKPENVFLSEKEDGSDFVKIVDAGSPALFGVRSTPHGRIIIGTPKYFSPEQATGRAVGLESDHFTLGIIGYQLLTGALPFFGATPDQLLAAIATGAPTPVGERTTGVVLPDQLQRIIHRCLAKDPGGRYPDLRALATDLAAVIKSTQPVTQKRKKFGEGREVSTVVAGPDLLSALGMAGDDEEPDDEATMMVSASEMAPQLRSHTTPQAQPPPPPSQNDLKNIPAPLMFTGALDGDELSAALAAATASVDAEQAPRPRRAAPSRPPARAQVDDDLAAAMASAAAAEGGLDDDFDLSGLHDEPAPPPPRPSAAQAPPAPARTAPKPRLTSDVLFDATVDVPEEPRRPVASPLATAADFAALSPVKPGDAGTPPAAVGPRRSGSGRTVGLAVAAVILLGGGAAAAWYFTQEPAVPPRQAGPERPTPPKKDPVAPLKEPGEKAPADQPPAAARAAADAAVAVGLAVRLESDPSGAAVFFGDGELGKTPLDLTLEGDEPRTYVLKLDGRGDLEQVVDPAALRGGEAPHVVKVELPAAIAEGPAKPAREPPVRKSAPPAGDAAKKPNGGGPQKRTPPKSNKLKNPFE